VKGYRFRLEAVLRVRRLQEEQARAALLQARRDESEAQQEHRRRVGLLRLRARVTTPEGPTAAFLAERDRRERLAGAVLASRAAELHAVQASGTRLRDWERAARDLATLERLDERQREEFVSEVLAAEQRATDEQATMRAARADRLAARAAARAAAPEESAP
jgi:flagellar biosynthesis chaperone FliJ